MTWRDTYGRLPEKSCHTVEAERVLVGACSRRRCMLGLAANAWSLGSTMQRSPAPQVLLQHVYSMRFGQNDAPRSAQTYYSLRPEI